MLRFLGVRIPQMAVAFLLATFVVFGLAYAAPGDRVSAAPETVGLSETDAAAMRTELGLDRPFWEQYVDFLRGLRTFDLGTSTAGVPVASLVGAALPATAALATAALAVSILVGLTMGVVAGLTDARRVTVPVFIVSAFLVALPSFALAITVRDTAIGAGWQFGSAGRDIAIGGLILPALATGLASAGYLARVSRAEVTGARRAEHVRMARARGQTGAGLACRHILRNAVPPVNAFAATEFAGLLGGTVIIERIFNVPGIGTLLYDSVQRGDVPVTVAIIMCFIAFHMVVTLLLDVAHAALDPRLRNG